MKNLCAYVFILAGLAVAVSCQAKCDTEHPCPNFCPNEYHEQCVSSLCTCPDYPCTKDSECPNGHMRGCPPGSQECVDGHCRCKR